jgi:two-component system sensor histidine kinase AlgZ
MGSENRADQAWDFLSNWLGLQPQEPAAALSTAVQYAAGVVLGALAGLYACAMLALVGAERRPGWPAPLRARCWPACWWRRWCCARGRTPAATTARLTELQSRIRPHFLFNTLNSAIAWCAKSRPRPSRCWKT